MMALFHVLLIAALCLGLAAGEGASGPMSGQVPDPETKAPMVAYDGLVPAGSGPFSLIVGLHGINGNEHQLVGSLRDGLQEAGLLDRYVVLCLKSKGAGWEEVDHRPIREAIAWACRTWPIDQRRIYGWGYSHGAFRYGVFGHQAQKLFAGVVLLSGGVGNPGGADVAAPTLSWYLIHGDADATVGVDRGRAGIALLTQAGYPAVYHEIIGEGHGTAGSAAARPYRVDALRWTDRLRNGLVDPVEPAAGFLRTLAEQLEAGKRLTASRVIPGLIAVGGPQADAYLIGLLASDVPALRGAAAKGSASLALGDGMITALAALARSDKGATRTAALESLGQAAHWQDARAAKALAGMLADVAAPEDLRAEAATGLGLAVPLQQACGNPDRAVYAPLIAALDDGSERVRRAAIMALMGPLAEGLAKADPATAKGAFGYRPQASADQRADPLAAWRRWLDGGGRW